jgi:predicted transcriptional regulator
MDLQIEGDNISSLRKQLQSMLWCLDKEIVDEIESDVKTDTIEDRLSYLEDEVENIADAVSEFDNRVIRSIH